MSSRTVFHSCMSLGAQYERDLRRELARQPPQPRRTIAAPELQALPPPVRRFIESSGIVERPLPSRARIVWREMMLRSGPDARWLTVRCEQVSFLRDPTRLALMRGVLSGVLPLAGYDRYRDGRGEMMIRLAGVVPLRRAHGRHMDESALITYLSEAMMLPALLADPRLQWAQRGEHEARATLHHGGTCAAGTFTFAPDQSWARFESHDRFRDGRVPQRQHWSAQVGDFRIERGLRVPTRVSARWLAKDRPFTYMHGVVDGILYDVSDATSAGSPPLLSSPQPHAGWRDDCCAPEEAQCARRLA